MTNENTFTLESLISQETGEESVKLIIEFFPRDLLVAIGVAFEEFSNSTPWLIQTGNGLKIETTGDFVISCLSIGFGLTCDAYLSSNKE